MHKMLRGKQLKLKWGGKKQRKKGNEFLLGMKTVGDEKIKSKVKGKRVEITREVISKVLVFIWDGLDTILPNPTQPHVTQLCRDLVEVTIKPNKD